MTVSTVEKLVEKTNGQINVLKSRPDYMSMILSSQVYDVALVTPLTEAINLSEKIGNNVLLKREDLQPIFSFKIRGAYNKISSLTPEEKKKGVVACSAGNHAQGVAYAARHLGIKAKIVMPLLTPEIKWKNVERMGAQVILFGDDFDEAKAECNRLSTEEGLTNIPPFDDPHVIAGQGTVGVEILRQHRPDDIYAIFAAVGGGGLISGIAAYVKRICPSIKVIGVEAIDSDAMTQSLACGYPKMLDEVGLFAEGAAVRQVGQENYTVSSQYVDEMVLVTNDEICAAIKDVFEDTRSVLETAGALGTAGMKKYAEMHNLKNKTLVSVASGANINFDRLSFVAERAELGEKKEVLVSVVIPETPGTFYKLYQTIHPNNVTEFSYRYSDEKKANIFMSFGVKNRATELPAIVAKMEALGFGVTDISDNELAKDHARYMIGGRNHVDSEHLFSFQFPERPGALKKFLSGIQSQWNISLFHYRNKGHDTGRVLAGIQVPPGPGQANGELPEDFKDFLTNLNYTYTDETNNPVFEQFLS
ncbi:Threonine dehydratase, mitochondrial [Smittium mucronatum]|uniref:Threonine dehydratase n=1 Tax=Smittium mucronatum TaxID=133383 RepID=A0A1R0H3J8_9FUNG|nr:Threonine dehydratase, mitochondrial [Smittium mucronatum]